jgi:hypothetical protein
MVAYPFGPIIHRFRRSALVESAPRRGHVDLADSMVRDRVRNPGDYFWFPLAQFTDNPCALVGATNSVPVSFYSSALLAERAKFVRLQSRFCMATDQESRLA